MRDSIDPDCHIVHNLVDRIPAQVGDRAASPNRSLELVSRLPKSRADCATHNTLSMLLLSQARRGNLIQ